MNIPTSLSFLLEIDDWSEKYLAIMNFGKTLEPLESKFKTNDNKIAGCQSRVWLDLKSNKGIVTINGEADSRLMQGLLAIIIEVYKSKTPQEIVELDEGWINQLDFDKNISMIRQTGMNAIIKNIKMRVSNMDFIA